MSRTKKNARTAANPNTYAAQFEKEGRRWCVSMRAPSLSDAENWAVSHAGLKGLRHIVTLPLNPET